MHAVRLHDFGPAENLRYETVPDPRPAPGQVRIAVAAAGVHLVDTMLRSGPMGGPFPPPQLPTVLGREVAGRVDAVGEGVDAQWLDRRVVTHLGVNPGGYAELAVRDLAEVRKVPDEVSFETAVAMIGTGRTTMGIVEAARLTPEDVVLVTAAAGGIGTLLIQYARRVGATVVGAAGGPAKAERVRELGADLAVDYNNPQWSGRIRAGLGDRPISIWLESVGGTVAETAFGLIADGGRIVSYGSSSKVDFEPAEAELLSRRISYGSPLGPDLMNRHHELADKAMAAVADGTWSPATQSFPLSQAPPRIAPSKSAPPWERWC